MNEIYVSTDVEKTRPNTWPNSMLSFGSAAYLADRRGQHLFSKPSASSWRKWRPKNHGVVEDSTEAWEACRHDLLP